MNVLVESIRQFSGWIAWLAVTPAVIASIWIIVRSATTLRAKRRVMFELRRSARVNPSVRHQLDAYALAPKTAASDEAEVREFIEAHLVNLSGTDKKIIEEGLTQANARGAHRFAEEMLMGAEGMLMDDRSKAA